MNRHSWTWHLAGFMLLILLFMALPLTALAETGYVTASALYMRAEPALDAKIVHTYSKGQKIDIIGKSQNGKWYKVQCGNKTGYVWKEYVSLQSVSSGSSGKSDEYTDADGGHHGSYRTASSIPTATSLGKKSKGTDVKKLQTALSVLGYYSGAIDGKYGNSTIKAVEKYQKAVGIAADGLAGRNTLKKLFNTGASGGKLKTEKLDWFKGKNSETIPKGAYFYVKDVKTGEVFRCKRWSGVSHMDVEPATAEDTAILSKIYGGSWSWDRRAILVLYKGHVYAASMNGMPHGQQTIQSNDFNGQFCIHFTGSKTHGSNRVDEKHQNCVKRASDYTW